MRRGRWSPSANRPQLEGNYQTPTRPPNYPPRTFFFPLHCLLSASIYFSDTFPRKTDTFPSKTNTLPKKTLVFKKKMSFWGKTVIFIALFLRTGLRTKNRPTTSAPTAALIKNCPGPTQHLRGLGYVMATHILMTVIQF
jgi:hypothetical protein